jgi:hypothetical protein
MNRAYPPHHRLSIIRRPERAEDMFTRWVEEGARSSTVEPVAHNDLDAGSNPAAPTIHRLGSMMAVFARKLRNRMRADRGTRGVVSTSIPSSYMSPRSDSDMLPTRVFLVPENDVRGDLSISNEGIPANDN